MLTSKCQYASRLRRLFSNGEAGLVRLIQKAPTTRWLNISLRECMFCSELWPTQPTQPWVWYQDSASIWNRLESLRDSMGLGTQSWRILISNSVLVFNCLYPNPNPSQQQFHASFSCHAETNSSHWDVNQISHFYATCRSFFLLSFYLFSFVCHLIYFLTSFPFKTWEQKI